MEKRATSNRIQTKLTKLTETSYSNEVAREREHKPWYVPAYKKLQI